MTSGIPLSPGARIMPGTPRPGTPTPGALLPGALLPGALLDRSPR
jgi:hypothetical protein